MSRKLRLKCPACQTLIETLVDDEVRITLECAACQKQFTAKVPPKGPEASPSQKSQPVVAAQPVAKPVAAKPVAAKPVAQPIAAQPVSARPVQPSGPPAGFDAAPAGFGIGAEDFSFPIAPTAYQPVRRRKPLNLRPILNIIGGVTAALLMLGLGLYGWNWASNTDWSTFSLMRDTGDGLTSEWLERIEQSSHLVEEFASGTTIDYEKLKNEMLEHGEWGETFLVRMVRVDNVPREKRTEFLTKSNALHTKLRDSMQAKVGTTPVVPDIKRMNEMFKKEPRLLDCNAATSAASEYIKDGIYDVHQPKNETQKIYYEELELVHQYLKELSYVRSTSQSIRRAEKIEQLADKVMDLAKRRSELPPSAFEQVPRDYDDKDRCQGFAQQVLITRIKRDTKPDKKLKDAVANFNQARSMLSGASRGRSHFDLKERFAEYRKARAESTELLPGDLFFVDKLTADEELEMVFRPARDAQPTPVKPSPPVEPAPRPATNSVASNSEPTSSSHSTSTPSIQEPTSTTTQSTAPSSATSPNVPSPLAPNMRDNFFRGITAGMNPNSSPPVDGQGMVGPPMSGPAMIGPPMSGPSIGGGPPPLSKNESVKIIINSSSLDGNELVKRLSASLDSADYRMNASNGKITLQIKYTGDMERVVQLIDFGKVTLIDSPERTIHVNGK